jgi:hypothetical protein
MPGSSTVPQSPRHGSNVRLLFYREVSSPLDHGEECRHQDSNLGKTNHTTLDRIRLTTLAWRHSQFRGQDSLS